jgi:drug/metabolite transporter (DMT)-like permease
MDRMGDREVAAAAAGAATPVELEAEDIVRDEAGAAGIAVVVPDEAAVATAAVRPPVLSRRTTYLAFGALIILALIWGYNWVVMKVAVQEYPQPFTFAAMRAFLAAIFTLAALALLRRPLRPKALRLTIIFGVLQTTGFMGLITWAVDQGAAGKASVLAYTMPFWLLLMAWGVLGERVRGLQWVSVVAALGGLVFVLSPWQMHGLFSSLLAIAAGILWASASILVKIMRKRHDIDVLSLVGWQTLFGAIPLIIIAVFKTTEAPVWTGAFTAALLFNAIPATPIAWLLWLYVLHRLPTGVAGISSLAVPVVGVASAWIQLGEQPGLWEALGMGLIVISLAILTAREMRISKRAGTELGAVGASR